MATIPSRLAKVATASGSWPVAQARSRALYRTWWRAAPEIVQVYAANIPATAVRARIRQKFEKNKYIDDLEAVDVLLHKSYVDFQETINSWKMDTHFYNLFAPESPPNPVTFMDKFLEGRSEGEDVSRGA